MTRSETRARLTKALAEMLAASDALAREVSEATLRRFTDAVHESRIAHDEMILASYRDARARK
jgi:hypothetical protein